MFCSSNKKESPSLRKVKNDSKHKKGKRNSNRSKRKYAKKNQSKFSNAMSSWAENFTVAATWQLKHQLAYWKARAISLEYENGVLHDVIRQNKIVLPQTSRAHEFTDIDDETPAGNNSNNSKNKQDDDFDEAALDTEYNESESESDENQCEGEDFEVSEEFIQFLTANAKYKEDARRERERLKAKMEEEAELDALEPQESLEQKVTCKKELYGDKWQRIMALENHLMSDFVNTSDKHKPMYWPNIPFNFNIS